MRQTIDVLVVGGGIIGLAAAFRLASEGFRVAVLDKGELGKEASWAGAGILFPLLPWDYPKDYAQWVVNSARAYGDFCLALHAASGIDPEYGQNGMVLLQATLPKEPVDIAIEACRFLGQEALFLPEVAQVRNPRILAALRQACAQKKVVFYAHEPLVSLTAKKGAIQAAQTVHHVIEAKQYVICAGAWSGQLLQSFLPPLEVFPVRGQMLLFALPKPPFSSIVYGDGVYGVPRRDGHFLLGATVEEAGFNPLPTQEAYRLLLEKSQKLGLDMPEEALVAQWTGLRPALRRLWPVIDRHPRIENLFVTTGHFRYGLTTAFSSAAMLLDLIQDRQALPWFRWPPSG